MTKFKKFTSIEKFSDVWAKAQKYNVGKVQLRSKIKLHGTNAGVRIVDGVFTAQKRTSDITPLSDNAGFAFWASNIQWKTKQDVIMYGEWAGPGVQKSDAISLIDRKRFFVFGILMLDVDEDKNNYIICPDIISKYLPDDPNIMSIPWHGEPMLLDSDNVGTARAIQTIVEEQVHAIGDEDPYVKEQFGISGVGEGLVIAPYNESGIINQAYYNTYVFKVKSEAHMVKKTKSAAHIQTEVPDSVKNFARDFVTDVRCQQMIDEYCEGSMSPKSIGTFLKNINADILKESTNELAGMDVEWKQVAKEINKRALSWFQEQNRV
jgi:hypothetical protein